MAEDVAISLVDGITSHDSFRPPRKLRALERGARVVRAHMGAHVVKAREHNITALDHALDPHGAVHARLVHQQRPPSRELGHALRAAHELPSVRLPLVRVHLPLGEEGLATLRAFKFFGRGEFPHGDLRRGGDAAALPRSHHAQPYPVARPP